MLEVDGIRADYGPIPAVRSVSLSVKEAQAVAILGRNGAGKSTTLSVLMGMKSPAKGAVRFDGQNILRMSPERRMKHGIALVPEGRGIFRSLTVRENLHVGAYLERLSTKAMRARVEHVTERFPRLAERMDQRAGSLSGGEAQMLAVARALMSQPRLLLLDEPSLGLAPVFVQELYDHFRELQRDGMTLLIVEQYAQVALRFASYAYVLHKGEVALGEEARNLRGNDTLLKTYMSEGGDAAA